MSNQEDTPDDLKQIALDPRMRSRFIRNIRRIFNTGAALYLTSLPVLILAAFCAREALGQLLQNRRDMYQEIEGHLRRHPDTENHLPDDPGILTFALAPALPTTARSTAQEQAKKIKTTFESIITNNPPSQTTPPAPQTYLNQLSPSTLSAAQHKELNSKLENHFKELERQFNRDQHSTRTTTTVSVIPCPQPISPENPNTTDSTPPGCDALTQVRTLLFVPSEFNDCRNNNGCSLTSRCPDKIEPRKQSCFPEHIYKSATRSQSLDFVLQILTSPTCEFKTDEESLVSAYFTTPEGIVRQWNCSFAPNTPPIPGNHNHPTHASYIRRLSNKANSNEYWTDIYIDSNGFGLIRTQCFRIDCSPKEGNRTLGVLCFDFTIPIRQILEPLTHSKIITIDEAKVIMPDAGDDLSVTDYWNFEVYPDTERRDTFKLQRTSAPTHIRSSFEKDLADTFNAIRQQLGSTPMTINKFHTSIVSLTSKDGTGNDGHFLIPGGWSDDGRSRAMLIVRPSISPLRSVKFLMAILASSSAIWMSIIRRANKWNKRISENELVVQLLRKLDIGIVLIDEDGLIMAANDAAENIIGMYLPRLNTWRLRITEGFRQERLPSDPMVRVADLIDPSVVMADAVAEARLSSEADQIRTAVRSTSYRTVWHQRLQGQPSTFYALMKDRPKHETKQTWVKITAAPVIIYKPGKKILTTSLSAFEPVTRHEEQLLKILKNTRNSTPNEHK
ncbi:PAS domain-containing protein [Corallococcus macrosporus]|uniref:PAS domain-containing protein n=1 Tax=Corallococcus macrosporus TaxID=35 RepID=UPI0002FD7A9C|nr:PAS domain-containing protein [Corallococcus macrosporus]